MAKDDERDRRRRPGATHAEIAFAGSLMAVIALAMLFDDEDGPAGEDEPGSDGH